MHVTYERVEIGPTRFIEIVPTVLMDGNNQPCSMGLMVIDPESKGSSVCILEDPEAVARFMLALTRAATFAFSMAEVDAAMAILLKAESVSEASAKDLLN